MKFQETSLLFPCLGVFLVVFSLVVFVRFFLFVCLLLLFVLLWFGFLVKGGEAGIK